MPDSESDIPIQNWVDRYLPASARPYARLARLDRPIGSWLLLLPCWWGLALATIHHPGLSMPSPFFMLLFALGSLVMRGAGCSWNDITDRKIDGQVSRTLRRPIPAGDLSVIQALVFLLLLLLLGLFLLLQFNRFTIVIGISALLLVTLYPFMKRITYWPQAWLGLTFNWGALVGWSAMQGGLSLPALLLYAAGFFWTLGYDTIYAHQDKEDDALIGVKSTALRLGEATPRWLFLFYGLCLILLAAAAFYVKINWLFWPFLFAAGLHLLWQIRTLDMANPANCLRIFKSNRDFGLIVFAGIVAGGF